jgi:hypothetical protein
VLVGRDCVLATLRFDLHLLGVFALRHIFPADRREKVHAKCSSVYGGAAQV